MKNKYFLMLFITAALFFLPSACSAANHYIRAGATGANNGADWTNAWTDLPATFVRGDIYYVAGGTYGGHTFGTADSGASLITIKKANAADNGNDAGWNASYATAQAVFTAELYITTDYWTLDGITGSGSDTSTYGFKIQMDTATGAVKGISTITSGVRDINIKHFAIILPGSAYDYGQVPAKLFATENVVISNSYLKNGSTNIGVWGCRSGCVIENNYIDDNWSSSTSHGGQIVPGNSQNLIIRNNTFRNSIVYLIGGHVTGCGIAQEISGGGHYGGGAWTFTATTLTDTTKNWIPNQYVGYTLSRNHNGSGAYSSWTILSNTSNTITVDNTPYDLNVGNAAAMGSALDDGDIYWITMTGTVSNITAGSFTDSSHAWKKDVTPNTYQLGITHSGSTSYYRISSINGNTINVLPAILTSDGRANGDTYLIKSCMAPSDNLQFYNNIIIGNGSPSTASGIISADSAYTDVLTNLKVYNNTFYNVGFASYGWLYTGALSNPGAKAIGKNNLFYNSQRPIVATDRTETHDIGYNAYLKSTGNMPAVGSETGMQRDDSASSPFADMANYNFNLVSGSLAINNGVNLGSPYNIDRTGTSRPQGSAWDIGAYEYVSNIDTTPPSAPTGLSVN